MTWLLDKSALLLAAVACAGAAWGLIHYSGEWFYLLLSVLAFGGLFADNRRLRNRLKEMGADPSRRR
jgi:lipoprotein signal peptidase